MFLSSIHKIYKPIIGRSDRNLETIRFIDDHYLELETARLDFTFHLSNNFNHVNKVCEMKSIL